MKFNMKMGPQDWAVAFFLRFGYDTGEQPGNTSKERMAFHERVHKALSGGPVDEGYVAYTEWLREMRRRHHEQTYARVRSEP